MIIVEHIIIKTSIPLQDETVHFKLHNVGVLYLSIQNTLSFFYIVIKLQACNMLRKQYSC